MIRMIATDLDGTLLNSKKEMPAELPAVVRALRERGIPFVPVSGRSYPNLADTFRHCPEIEDFICLNGNLVMHQGRVVGHSQFTTEELRRIVADLRREGFTAITLNAIHTCYYDVKDAAVRAQIDKFFTDVAAVDRLEDVIDTIGPVCKISSIDPKGVEEHSFPTLGYLGDDFYLANAGDNWFDIMPKGHDKGVAMGMLANAFDIEPEEIMIFGDFLNDLPMMKLKADTWCMKNGHPDVKKISAHVTEWTNEENGVIRTIQNVLDIKI